MSGLFVKNLKNLFERFLFPLSEGDVSFIFGAHRNEKSLQRKLGKQNQKLSAVVDKRQWENI